MNALTCISTGRHEGYYRSTKQQTVVIPPDIDRPEEPVRHIDFEEGELVKFEYSYKVRDNSECVRRLRD